MGEPKEPVRARLRRWYVPDAVYFIVAVTQGRRSVFAHDTDIALLRDTLHRVQVLHPFVMRAYAFMPEHLHLLIFVPESSSISKIMQSLEWNYTRNYKEAHDIRASTHLWQRGFWDHVIRDDADLEWYMDYIHYNPVKHGLTSRPLDYPHTSFHHYVRIGWYDPDWGSDDPPALLVSRPAKDYE